MVRTPFAALAEAFEKLEATNSGLKLSDRQARRITGGFRDGRDRVKNDLTNGQPQGMCP
jgi:hypothetical protein